MEFKYSKKYIPAMNKEMKYLKEHKSATSYELTKLDIDKPYLYQALKHLYADAYIDRKRMSVSGNAYRYFFLLPFYIDINAPKEIKLDDLGKAMNNMIRLSAY